jgi:hypothetical protein
MKNVSAASLLFVTIFLSSCATTRSGMQEVSLPPQRVAENGYSLVPLDEAGWLILHRDSESLVLGKRGSDPDENIIIRAFAKVLPPLKSDEEFVGFAKSVLIMDGATRHKVLSQETKLVKVKSQSCARSDTVMEDNTPVRRTSRTDPMILEAFSLLCKHPNGSTGIVVAYSHRFYQGHKDAESSKKAQKIFDSLEFSNL